MLRQRTLIAGGMALLLLCCIWSERKNNVSPAMEQEQEETTAGKIRFQSEVKLLRSIGHQVFSATR